MPDRFGGGPRGGRKFCRQLTSADSSITNFTLRLTRYSRASSLDFSRGGFSRRCKLHGRLKPPLHQCLPLHRHCHPRVRISSNISLSRRSIVATISSGDCPSNSIGGPY